LKRAEPAEAPDGKRSLHDMPIRPEHRKFYGPEFRALRAALIAASGDRCSRCGIELAEGLNGAHLKHDPRNLADLAILCPACHASHDAPHRIAMQRRTRAKRHGQLWLLDEIEWSPYAAWEIPGPVFDRIAQSKLFE
jgi:hypothetical protein